LLASSKSHYTFHLRFEVVADFQDQLLPIDSLGPIDEFNQYVGHESAAFLSF
jgi:hypothetical protein